MLETLHYTIRIGGTSPTLYFDFYLFTILAKRHYDSRTTATNIVMTTYLHLVFRTPSPFQCRELHAGNPYKLLYFTCIISYTWHSGQIFDWFLRRM